jgi:hypothetical protein
MIIASTAKMLVGVQRITDFLVADEIPPRQEGTRATTKARPPPRLYRYTVTMFPLLK